MKYILSLLVFSVSVFSNADCVGTSCTGVTIDRLYLYLSQSKVSFSTSGDESKLDCTTSTGMYISLPLDLTSSKEAYSLLLAAHQSQNTVWVKTTGAGTSCEVVYLVSDK